MIKSIRLTIMLLFLAVSSVSVVWAAVGDDAPLLCPAPEAIQNAGLSGVREDKTYQMYGVYQISKYDTPVTWGFFIAIPTNQATSRGDAMNKAKEALQSLTGNPQPIPRDETHKQWYCLYENNYHYFAAAFTPLISQAALHEALTVPSNGSRPTE